MPVKVLCTSELLDFCSLYKVKSNNGYVILYKAVNRSFSSIFDDNFMYSIGKVAKAECSTNRQLYCAKGLHVSNIRTAIEYAESHRVKKYRILKCSVPIDCIVVPLETEGKARTSKLKVIEEVPFIHWGIRNMLYVMMSRIERGYYRCCNNVDDFVSENSTLVSVSVFVTVLLVSFLLIFSSKYQ